MTEDQAARRVARILEDNRPRFSARGSMGSYRVYDEDMERSSPYSYDTVVMAMQDCKHLNAADRSGRTDVADGWNP